MIPETILSTYVKRLGEMNAASCIVLSNALTAVNQVFSSNSIDGELSPTNLSVRYVTADEFHDLHDGDTSAYFEPKTLYIVSSDQLNAYNERILSVASPEELADAANKEYVDNGLSAKRGFDDLSYGAGDWFVTGPKSFRLVKQASPNNYWLAVVDDVEWGLLYFGSGSISDWTFGPLSDNSTIAGAEDATSLTFTLKSGTYALVKGNRLALHSDLMLKADISQIDPGYTHIAFADGTTSSYNIVGTLDRTWMQNAGIYGTNSWTKPIAGISIGTNVSSIGNYTFGSSNLTSIQMSNTIRSISYLAFASCTKLSSITIPSSVFSMNASMFNSTTPITSITFENRTSSDIPANSPWGLLNTPIISTWNDASQEWANEQFIGKADLPYAMVTPSEWEFGGEGYDPDSEYAVTIDYTGEEDGYTYTLWVNGDSVESILYQESADVTDLTFVNVGIYATRTGIHLLDHANNLINTIMGNMTLTLPQFVTGKMRDLFVRLEFGAIAEGASVPTVIFKGQGNEAPGETYAISFVTDNNTFPVPDSGGTWWYSLTECAPHVFTISLKKLQSVTQPTQAQNNS